MHRRTYSVPLTGLDESGEKGQELALAQLFVSLNLGQRKVDLWEAGDGKGVLIDAVGHLHDQQRLILLGK